MLSHPKPDALHQKHETAGCVGSWSFHPFVGMGTCW